MHRQGLSSAHLLPFVRIPQKQYELRQERATQLSAWFLLSPFKTICSRPLNYLYYVHNERESTMKRFPVSIIFLLFFFSKLPAQELDCDIQIDDSVLPTLSAEA